MTKTCVGVLLSVALLGCSSDSPPGAAVTKDVTLPDSALTRLQNVSLIRAGASFILAGYDSATGQVRWGRLTPDGVLAEEAGFALAKPVVGPAFGATTKVTPGDQLIAIVVTTSAKPNYAYDVSAIVQTSGAATAASAVVLDSLPLGTDPAAVQIAAGAATSGNVGFAAWGIRGQGRSPNYLLLPADALTTATASTMLTDLPVPNWSCLATTGGATGLGFSVVAPDPGDAQTSDFHTAEVDETGATTSMLYQFTVGVSDCRVVASPGPTGSYVLALQTDNAIDFATYYPPAAPGQDGTVTTYNPVLSASGFGDPLHMPSPAWTSPAGGGDISIGLARASGPQVYRYAYNAIPHGSPLTLRSEKGQTGPVASWVGPDAVYVTYTDQSKATPSLTKRYFMRIESPATLP